MFWFVFAVCGAFLDATYYMSIKKILSNNAINRYALASGVFLSAFIVLFLISLLKGIPEIGSFFYSPVVLTGVLNFVAVILYFKALQITDLSLSVPMLSFTPIFLIFISFIMLNEAPSFFGVVGIFLIVMGSYILNTSGNSRKLLDPVKRMIRTKGIFFMLVVAFLYSLSSNFDKLVVKNSDSFFGHAIVFLFIGSLMTGFSLVKRVNFRLEFGKYFHKFFLTGLILASVAVSINIAYTMQIVPYVISLKRLNILFSVIYGGLIFKEKHMSIRVVGTLIMLVGVFFIVLF